MTFDDHLSVKPRYRIQAVAEMIGITTPNLRAWERRYGIPRPQRGENAYRLYSNRDITLLKRMKALCDQGHAPSDAAQIAQRLLESELQVQHHPTLGYKEALAKIIAATESFQPHQLDQALLHAQTLGSAWEIYSNILEPALVHIGCLWQQDERFVAHEHLLSQAVKNTLSQMLKIIMPPFPRGQILFACVEKELHDITLNALSLRVAHFGYRPIILGANTPPSAISNAVHTLQPAAVILSITTPINLLYTPQYFEADLPSSSPNHLLQALMTRYIQEIGSIPWLLGGQGLQVCNLESMHSQYQRHLSSDVETLDLLIKRIENPSQRLQA